jgi:hypothetical protein
VTWDTRALDDGHYDLRLRSVCQSSSDEGLILRRGFPGFLEDSTMSSVVAGVVDRQVPVMLRVEPLGGQLSEGSELRVTFSEALQCGQPWVFGASIELVPEEGDAPLTGPGRRLTGVAGDLLDDLQVFLFLFLCLNALPDQVRERHH